MSGLIEQELSSDELLSFTPDVTLFHKETDLVENIKNSLNAVPIIEEIDGFNCISFHLINYIGSDPSEVATLKIYGEVDPDTNQTISGPRARYTVGQESIDIDSFWRIRYEENAVLIRSKINEDVEEIFELKDDGSFSLTRNSKEDRIQ